MIPPSSGTKIHATIKAVRTMTPHVRLIQLEVQSSFTFFAGQSIRVWHASTDGELKSADFSVASSPYNFVSDSNKHQLTIMVKKSRSVVATWLHDDAQVGQSVMIEGGNGNTYFLPTTASRVVLIAGGMGITPMLSIMSEICDGGYADSTRVTMLYSARHASDFVCLDDIDRHCATKVTSSEGGARAILTCTSNANGEDASSPIALQHAEWRNGRISQSLLNEVVPASELVDTVFYLCGPPAMCDDMASMLFQLGALPGNVRYERWWSQKPLYAPAAAAVAEPTIKQCHQPSVVDIVPSSAQVVRLE